MIETSYIVIFLLACAALWYMLTGEKQESRGTTRERDMIDAIEDDIDRERREHHAALSTALSACNDTHPDAVTALCWLAAADGSVSKQELRTIFRFCDEQGTKIDKDAYKAIDSLNAGMSMKVTTTEASALNAVRALADKAAAYKLAFYGAANKLCGSQKKINPAKQRFLKAAEALAGGTTQT